MDDEELSIALFEATRSNIPDATHLALEAYRGSPYFSMDKDTLKNSFSSAVSDLQIGAYNLYLNYEREAAQKAIIHELAKLIEPAGQQISPLELFASKFGSLDRFSLRLTQSRRSRAGTAFEVIVSEMFSKLGYPYSAQADIDGSKPDYVLPSIDWYTKYPADSIIFTLKRTLRERWRQIVTESGSGKFYLATIDEKVSAQGLVQMMQRNIMLVVPKIVKLEKYADKLNVISFEDFFEDHLDPAMSRWRKSGAI